MTRGTQRLRVHKHSYELALPRQGSTDIRYQSHCLQAGRQSGRLFALRLRLSISYTVFLLLLFSRLKHHLCFLTAPRWEGGGRGRGGNENSCKDFLVPGTNISDADPGKLYYLPLLEWEKKIAGTSTALGYTRCNCLYKAVPWEPHRRTRHTQQTRPSAQCAEGEV